MQPSKQYSPNEYILITEKGEPESFQEVKTHKQKKVDNINGRRDEFPL